MSFRARMLLLLVIIVVIPVIAVALVLSRLAADSAEGHADSQLSQALEVAMGVYEQSRTAAVPELRRVTRDRRLREAVRQGRAGTLRERAEALARRDDGVEAIALYDLQDRLIAAAGDPDAVAYATATPSEQGGGRLGRIAASSTTAAEYSAQVARLTGLEARVLRDGELIAATIEGGAEEPAATTIVASGKPYRGRYIVLRDALGPALEVGLFQPLAASETATTNDQLLLVAIIVAFFLLAVAALVFIVRSFGGQIDRFLSAARAVGRGEFQAHIPTEGADEFAALGREFNAMSQRLQTNADELERERSEREEAIRRIGEAFAGGLDPRGMAGLAARTAMEACAADAARGVAGAAPSTEPVRVGSDDPSLRAALEEAEHVARHSPERPARLSRDGVHALATALRGRRAGDRRRTLGFLSIARSGPDFDPGEGELFGYLAGQASVSLDNASLHETVQAQARTDPLTGLSNRRQFEAAIEVEIGRSHRFGSAVGLVMIDLDGFKLINDRFGHQEGDRVLVEVAALLRQMTRDVDEVARYGGDEIAVILPETDTDGGALLAERVRAGIERLEIERVTGGSLRLTGSFGVACLPGSAADRGGLLAAADSALYRAKRAGGNRVERADAATVPR